MQTLIVHEIDNKNIGKKIPIEKAVEFLTGSIKTVQSVKQWADGMGYSRNYFARKIHAIYFERPVDLFHKAKLAAIVRAWQEKPHAKAWEIASETGFKNGKSLGQFLSRNFHVTARDVRKKCGNGFDVQDIIRMKKEEIRKIFI